MAVAPIEHTFNQSLWWYLEHLAEAEECLQGMGPAGLQLLVVPDGKIIFQNVFLDHFPFGAQFPVPLAQLLEGRLVFHVVAPCAD